MGLDAPDVIQPVVEGHVLADPPHQTHGGMGVGVDKARHGGFAAAVQHNTTVILSAPLVILSVSEGSDLRYPPFLDKDIHLRAVQRYVFEKYTIHGLYLFSKYKKKSLILS